MIISVINHPHEKFGNQENASWTLALLGQATGQASLASRGKARELRAVDWAHYPHYGSYDFVLKEA